MWNSIGILLMPKFWDETIGLQVTPVSMNTNLHASAIWGKCQYIHAATYS